MYRLPLMVALLLAGPALAEPAIAEAEVRAFVARQEQAWNAGDLEAYFSGFAPGATFTDQAYVGDKPPVSYGTSPLVEARALARKAKTKTREHGLIRRIETRGGGASVLVVSNVTAIADTAGKTRRLCAIRRQTLSRLQGRLRATDITDTYYPCPR